MTLRTTPRGLAIIKEFEGLRLKAYLCPAGVWTIGYGHTSAAGAPPVTKGMLINRAQAESILAKDIDKFEDRVIALVNTTPIKPHELDAFVSLAFNIGVGGFAGSTVLKRFKRGDKAGAAEAFLAWNKASVNGRKVVLAGLTRRRQAERSLFLGDYAVAEAIAPTCLEFGPMAQAICKPEKREPMIKSGTGNAAAATGSAGVMVAFEGARQAVGLLGEVKNSATEAAGLIPGVPDSAAILVGLGVLIAVGAGVIWFRRWRRSREDEVVETGPEVVS